jgi:hypothetical protein
MIDISSTPIIIIILLGSVGLGIPIIDAPILILTPSK